MTRKVADDVATSEVVWAAAERIGKSSNAQDVNRICEYLISKHWFQTAGDLRVARDNAQEWLSLEVPGRLKIAIQEVLDAPLDLHYSPGKTHNQDSFSTALYPSDSSVADAVGHPQSSDCTQSYNAYSVTYDTSTDVAGGYDQSQYTVTQDDAFTTDVQDDAVTAAAHAAAWEAYYAANGYYSYGTTEEAAQSGQWDDGRSTELSEDVVEAQEVVVEDAVAAETLAVPSCEVFESTGHSASVDPVSVQAETWRCGQCTFVNRIDVSFCDICSGHISLSPDAHQASSISVDAPTQEVVVADLHESYSSRAETEDAVTYSDSVVPTVDPAAREADTEPTPSSSPSRSHTLHLPLYVTIPSPSKPLSPMYSPSAPEFEESETEEPTNTSMKSATLVVCHVADERKATEICAPVLVDGAASSSSPSPSPPKIDYRALAFKRTPSLPSVTTSYSAPTNSSNTPVRLGTEFSF